MDKRNLIVVNAYACIGDEDFSLNLRSVYGRSNCEVYCEKRCEEFCYHVAQMVGRCSSSDFHQLNDSLLGKQAGSCFQVSFLSEVFALTCIYICL